MPHGRHIGIVRSRTNDSDRFEAVIVLDEMVDTEFDSPEDYVMVKHFVDQKVDIQIYRKLKRCNTDDVDGRVCSAKRQKRE